MNFTSLNFSCINIIYISHTSHIHFMCITHTHHTYHKYTSYTSYIHIKHCTYIHYMYVHIHPHMHTHGEKNLQAYIPRGWYWSCNLSQRKVPSGKPYKITWLPLGRWESRYFSVCMTLEYICSGVVIPGIGSALLRWKKQQVSD